MSADGFWRQLVVQVANFERRPIVCYVQSESILRPILVLLQVSGRIVEVR